MKWLAKVGIIKLNQFVEDFKMDDQFNCEFCCDTGIELEMCCKSDIEAANNLCGCQGDPDVIGPVYTVKINNLTALYG